MQMDPKQFMALVLGYIEVAQGKGLASVLGNTPQYSA
jgi:hypothetical protein